MRSLAVAVGCLLLVGGITLVAIADQERMASIAAVKAEIARVEGALDTSRGENRELAEKLTWRANGVYDEILANYGIEG